MLETLRPLTLVVGVVAVWSVGVLLLALAGLGGRIGPHPPDLALVPAVPALKTGTGVERLGPASDYLAVGQRPLFQPERRPAPVAVVDASQQVPFEGVLTSVLLTDGLKLAIFSENNGQVSRRVRVGEEIPGTGWRLASLEPRGAVLEGPAGQRVLGLRVFDGQGGAAPTVVNFPAPANKPDPAEQAAGGASGTLPPPTPGVQVPPVPSAPPSLVEQASQMAAEGQRSAEERAEIEAIRARIEARRAQLREQARDNHAPTTDR